jgi:hypothetical protein
MVGRDGTRTAVWDMFVRDRCGLSLRGIDGERGGCTVPALDCRGRADYCGHGIGTRVDSGGRYRQLLKTAGKSPTCKAVTSTPNIKSVVIAAIDWNATGSRRHFPFELLSRALCYLESKEPGRAGSTS